MKWLSSPEEETAVEFERQRQCFCLSTSAFFSRFITMQAIWLLFQKIKTMLNENRVDMPLGGLRQSKWKPFREKPSRKASKHELGIGISKSIVKESNLMKLILKWWMLNALFEIWLFAVFFYYNSYFILAALGKNMILMKMENPLGPYKKMYFFFTFLIATLQTSWYNYFQMYMMMVS